MMDQFKLAAQLMKNLSPQQIKELMQQAKESQAMLKKQIMQLIEKAIEEKQLVSRSEVQQMIQNALQGQAVQQTDNDTSDN